MEEWTQARGFENYEVSSEGRVRNKSSGRILRTYVDKKGDERVSLKEGGKKYNRKVSRMTAEAFVETDDYRLDVGHRDGNKEKNRADNLVWRTRSESIRNTYIRGREQLHRMRPVRCVETGEEWRSIKECSEATGLNRYSISKCVNNPAVKTMDGRHFEPIE